VCTLALFFQTFDTYPLLVAANRDEHFDRPSLAPALLQTEPQIIAGKDLRAGGTWLGVNEHGLAVGILNRRSNGASGTNLAPSVARSRGLLCLDLLTFKSAETAAAFIAAHDDRYNPFTVVFADKNSAYVAYNNDPNIIIQNIEPGLHVFSSAAELDLRSVKADRAHQRFAGIANDFAVNRFAPRRWIGPLQSILADHSLREGSNDPGEAICVHRDESGTVSSSLIFYRETKRQFETFHCLGSPCQNAFGDALSLKLR
jgi:uncharacterized protein with NRDE domain